MSDLGEAIGTASEGTIASAAVERERAATGAVDAGGHTGETRCLNCGTALVGSHCHACGQRAHVHRTLGAFFHDLVHGVLHFDGKLWRTLPLLAWHPGRLTREYIDGRRASYVSPIALFLFVVFLTFALWSMLGNVGTFEADADPASRAELQASIAEVDESIEELEADLTQAGQGEASAAEIARIEDELENQRLARRLTGELLEAVGSAEESGIVVSTTPGTPGSAPVRIIGGNGFLDWINEGWREAKANPEFLIYKLQNNAYKFSWLLIPLSLPFMWLLFPFSRRYGMYDHTVFVTYSIAFMSALAVVASLAARWNIDWLTMSAVLFAPVHLYRHLRGTYALSRTGAAWRLIVLSGLIWVVLSVFSAIILALVM